MCILVDMAVNLYNVAEDIHEGLLTRIFHVPLPGIFVCSYKKYTIFLSWLVSAVGLLHSKEGSQTVLHAVICIHQHTYSVF